MRHSLRQTLRQTLRHMPQSMTEWSQAVNITSLEPPQTVARTGEHVDAMLGVKPYAERNGFGERTVRTWLAQGKLTRARKLNGVWMIPADDRPVDEPAGELALRAVQHVPQTGGTLEAELASSPAFLELEAAARLLGIPVSAIRRSRAYFELVPFGPNGSLVMPAAVVRRIAGIA